MTETPARGYGERLLHTRRVKRSVAAAQQAFGDCHRAVAVYQEVVVHHSDQLENAGKKKATFEAMADLRK